MNLQGRIDQLSEILKTYNVDHRCWEVHRDLPKFKFRGVTPGADYDMIDAMLLRAPLPPIVLVEGPDAEYFEVIGGHAVLDTAMDVLNNLDIYEPYNLVRRIKETRLDVVIFRCNMKREDVAFLAKKFYNLNVNEE